VLVRAQDLPLTPLGALRLGLAGYFFSIFLPGSVGGDLIKAAGLASGQRRRTVAVATVLIDRAVGVLGLVWVVALLGGVFWLSGNPVLLGQRYLQTLVLTSAAIAGGSVLLWLGLGVLPPHRADRFAGRLERIPKLGGVAAEFWRAVWMYRSRGRWVAGALAIGVAAHFALVLMFYLAAHTVQLPGVTLPSLAEHFLVVPVGLIVEGVFPTPGGVGGGEAFFGWLYELLGRPGAAGAFAALAKRVITWIVGLIGYVVYLSMKPDSAGQTAAEPAAVEPEAAAVTA
jgi:glycosyltransferase 2 family protein